MRIYRAVQWFVSLVQRDMELFEVDETVKEKTYQHIKDRKKEATETHDRVS